MFLNQDKVPVDLEDALKTIKEGLDVNDIAEMKRPKFVPSQLHFTVGMFLRNEWSLWDKDTILVQWFKRTYGVDHADDISGIILDCLYRDIMGKPRQDKEVAQKCLDHWKELGNK